MFRPSFFADRFRVEKSMSKVAEIVWLPFKDGDLQVTMKEENGGYFIEVTSSLAMKKDVAAWCLGPKDKKLAGRLLACIQSGKAFTGYHIMTDVEGKTYISARHAGFFHGKQMGMVLRSLGF